MIGDLPEADAKPPPNMLFICKLNPVGGGAWGGVRVVRAQGGSPTGIILMLSVLCFPKSKD